MSVAKILSDVKSAQTIFDLTNSVLELTNASSWLDLMRCIFHFNMQHVRETTIQATATMKDLTNANYPSELTHLYQ